LTPTVPASNPPHQEEINPGYECGYVDGPLSRWDLIA